MNERIKEVITEFGMYHDSELYEIAEAVVRECMAIADKTQLVDRQLAVSFALKEHFGVE